MKLGNAIISGVAVLCLVAVSSLGQNPHASGGPGGAQGAGAGGLRGAAGNAMGSDMARGNNGSMTDRGSTMNGSNRASASSPTTLLESNTKLNNTLTSNLHSKGLLPTGANLKDTCSGFMNLGQCIAAIHVSHNLSLSFDCMKANMTGTAPAQGVTCPDGTGTSKLKMGKSIQALSPNSDAKTESKAAQKQANADIKDAEKNS